MTCDILVDLRRSIIGTDSRESVPSTSGSIDKHRRASANTELFRRETLQKPTVSSCLAAVERGGGADQLCDFEHPRTCADFAACVVS